MEPILYTWGTSRNGGRRHTAYWNGRKYHRYPDSSGGVADYFWAHYLKTPCSLHRDVWKFHHGPIGPGGTIHHKDGNTLNNQIENLECLPCWEHSRATLDQGLRDYLGSDEVRSHLERIRPQAAEWHRSEEGRRWHIEHARNIGFGECKPEPRTFQCLRCGASFEAIPTGRNKWCSPACYQVANRQAVREYRLRKKAGIPSQPRNYRKHGTDPLPPG